MPFHHWDKVLLGEPGREQQLENYRTTIRNMAKAGVTMLGHHFMPTYVWRTDLRARGRGGALVTAFDADHVAQGNALAGYKLAPDRPLLGRSTPIGCGTTTGSSWRPSCRWPRRSAFAWRSIPTTRRSPTGLVGSPASCPVPKDSSERGSYQAAARRGASTYASGPYPRWPVEIASNGSSTRSGRPADLYIHFRDVQGVAPRFVETFLGDGNYDPPSVLRRLRGVGFDGFIIDDHVPAMIGDEDTWADTASSAAYASRGRPTPSATSRACSPRSTPRTAHDR